MLRKPEKRAILYYYKCLLGCDKPYGIMQSSRSQAERGWFHHAMSEHVGKVRIVPPYIVKEKVFKAVKD